MSGKKVYVGKKGTKKSYPTRHRSKTEKRSSNRFEIESNSAGVSASAKKLKLSDKDFDVNNQFGYRIINFLAVFSVIAQHVKCKRCDADITFRERSPRGLGLKIVIACPNCSDVEIPSSTSIRNAYEINRRIVLAMRLLGVDLNGLMKSLDLGLSASAAGFGLLYRNILILVCHHRPEGTLRFRGRPPLDFNDCFAFSGEAVHSICLCRLNALIVFSQIFIDITWGLDLDSAKCCFGLNNKLKL